MFGDFGHGLCMFFAGLVICCKSNAWKKEGGMKKFIAELRYMILLMGFFAAYCGLIYNEFFSIPIPLADSCYEIKNIPDGTGTKNQYLFKGQES
jgi:V-type H+-transporting ATPase subunit a